MGRGRKLYRDIIHHDVQLDRFAVAVIDTPEFQRLDGIKQLGFAYCAYRNAKYSRFEHSVGTYWQAREIVNLLPQNHERLGLPFPQHEFSALLGHGERLIQNLASLVSYAGLLHDITHIPFGHTLEDEFQGIYGLQHDALESPRLPYVLFDPRSTIARLFESREPWLDGVSNEQLRSLLFVIVQYRDEIGSYRKEKERTFTEIVNETIEQRQARTRKQRSSDITIYYLDNLIRWYQEFRENKLFHPFMSDIISNTVCADILDYVKRDAQATGLEMDYDKRILQYFVLGRERSPEGPLLRLALCIRNPRKGTDRMDIITEVLNILKCRYVLAERVYYHKTKVAAGSMLAKALSLIGGGPPEPNVSMPGHSLAIAPEEHVLSVRMTDEGFLCWIEEKAGKKTTDAPESTIAKEMGAESEVSQPQATGQPRLLEESLGPLNEKVQGRGWDVGGLVAAIRQRQLFKPAVIVTTSLAEKERRTSYFVTRYHTRQDCAETEKTMEQDLGLPAGSLIIYCPAYEPHVKSVETRVLVEGPVAKPLWRHPLFRDEARVLTDKYASLWKLYVFLDAALFADPMIRQQVAKELHKRENFELVNVEDLTPYPWLSEAQLALWTLYQREQTSEIARFWHPNLPEVIQDPAEWSQLVDVLTRAGGRFEQPDGNSLSQISASLYLFEFETVSGLPESKQEPTWRGRTEVIANSDLVPQLVKPGDLFAEVERRIKAAARDRRRLDDLSVIREAFFSVFRDYRSPATG